MSRIRIRRHRRLPAFRRASSDPQTCARYFGELIRSCRELDGRPIEELAAWPGLTREQWEAVETGQARVSMGHVLLLAGVFNLSDRWLARLLSFAAGAQER